MGIELARAYVRVRGDASMLSGDLAGVRGILANGLQSARTYAAGFLIGFARMGEGLLAVGRAARNSFEMTRTSFAVLIGSMEETDKLLRKLTSFAVKTPFEMPQLLNVTRELLTFGERGERVMKTLKMLGDAAQGDARKFAILGLVYNQIRGIGRITSQSQDFRQLSSRGILTLPDMAKYFGKTQNEVARMKIKFEDVRGALEMLTSEGGRYYNAMEKQSQTIIGLTSTLNDAWNIMARGIADSVYQADKLALKMKIEVVTALWDAVEATKGIAGGMVVGAIQTAKMTAAVLGLAAAFRLLGISRKAAMLGAGFGSLVIALGAAIGGLTTAFLKTAPAIQMVTDVSKNLALAWRYLKEGIVNLADSIAWGIDASSTKMANWITDMSAYLVQGARYVKEFMIVVGYLVRNGLDTLYAELPGLFIHFTDVANLLLNVWDSVFDEMMRSFSGFVAFVSAIKEQIVAIFSDMGFAIVSEGAAAWAGFQAAMKGEGFNAIVAAMDAETRKRKLEREAENIKNGKKPPENPFEAAMKAARPEAEKAEEAESEAREKSAEKWEEIIKRKEAVVQADEKIRQSEAEVMNKRAERMQYWNQMEQIFGRDMKNWPDKEIDRSISLTGGVEGARAQLEQDKKNRQLAEEQLKKAETEYAEADKQVEEARKRKEAALKGKDRREFFPGIQEELEIMAREARRRIRDREAAFNSRVKKKAPEDELAQGEMPGRSNPVIEPGRYGFVQFGQKIQDAILKGKGVDHQMQMVGLLEQGNGIQQQLLNAVQNNGIGGLAP